MPLSGSPFMWFLVAIFLLLDVRGKYGLPFIFCIHLIYASFSLQLYISSRAIFVFWDVQVGMYTTGFPMFHSW